MKYFDEGTHPEDKAGMSSFLTYQGKYPASWISACKIF